jgi:phenylalanyl-tRNA synthetase beta chain
MRILHSWLQKYVEITLTPQALAEKLGMLGLEVENIEHLGEKYGGFVVGKVEAVEKHPNADKLTVCVVDVGTTKLRIVCGAPNVAPGQKVPVGTVGAVIPKNQHDPQGKPFTLARTKIRGVESSGMICSEFELDLGKGAEGIMVLEADAKPGQSLAEYLGLNDVAYDIEITPNRPDWLSHNGVAREAGVLSRKKARLPRVRVKESEPSVQKVLRVKVIDRKNCLRFAARMIRGVKIGPSPMWIKNALRNAGLRPRNNVVDITNYVMLECGQPLHAFDYRLLRGATLEIRRTDRERNFTTLDGKERILPAGTVMVCDMEREVSIAGIMGGANSEINDATVDIVLESACWNPTSIRRTRRALGITTDASQRFERGSDPEGVWYGLQRATQLIQQVAGGQVLHGTIDKVSKPLHPAEINLKSERVNGLLGTSLTNREITGLLRLLNIELVEQKKGQMRFRVPTYRVDLEREVDLIEEVARVYGYDRIVEKSTAPIDFSNPFQEDTFIGVVRNTLAGFGFREAMSYSLQEEGTSSLVDVSPVRLLNPQTSEYSVMRTSLIPGLVEAVARNVSFGNRDLRFFEIGKVYRVDSSIQLVENYVEEDKLGLLISGGRDPRHWSTGQEYSDVFDLKGEVLDLLEKFALDKRGFISYSTSNRLADRAIAIEINGSYVGYFGQVSEEIVRRHQIEQEVFVAEFSLGVLRSVRGKKGYLQLPKYPKVRRDVSFIVDASKTAREVELIIERASGSLVQSAELFDVYEGENLPAGKKSFAIALQLMSREKTLTDQEIESEVQKIIQAVITESGAVLRTL